MDKIVNKLGKAIFICLFLFNLSGCELLADSKNASVNFSHYYLWIKSLSDEELDQEIIQQKNNKQSGTIQADVQLIMLYSLPNSPLHNPYTAKTMLNIYPLTPHIDTTFSATDLAFVVMLKDQLNQQLLLLEKLSNFEGVYLQAKKVNSVQQVKINQLNQQIIQLKKIEKTLSKRGQ
jgi:hypothetical protein